MENRSFPWFTVTTAIMLFALIASVAVQLNDPDPALWILIYSIGIFCTVGNYFDYARPVWLWLFSLGGFCGVGWILLNAPSIEYARLFNSLQMNGEGVEEAREAGGLILQSSWLWYLALRHSRQPKET